MFICLVKQNVVFAIEIKIHVSVPPRQNTLCLGDIFLISTDIYIIQ